MPSADAAFVPYRYMPLHRASMARTEAAVLRNVLVARPQCAPPEQCNFVLSHLGTAGAVYSMDLQGHSLLPALVNAHEHLHLNSIPALRSNQTFANSYAWASQFESHCEKTEVRSALAIPKDVRHWHGGLKNALCGTTTVMHHDPMQMIHEHAAFPVRVVQPYGWAHSLNWHYGPQVARSFHCTARDVAWFVHLAEGTDAVAAGELQQLQAMQCLQSNTVLIHGVALNDRDIASVIASGAALVWCPSSNLSLLGCTVTTERLRALFDRGRLTLGTDSRLSGARDLLAELQLAARHSDFCARELLQMVTVDARRLLRAAPAPDDVIIFRSRSADPYDDFLRLARHQLRAVIRNGVPLIADPDFEDWFVQRHIAYTAVRLDGRIKLCASSLLSACGEAAAVLEPGLEPYDCRFRTTMAAG